MTTPDTDTPDPTSDDEELPDRQCVEVATATGERCRNAAIPGVDRCHAHVDYTELAETYDDGVDTPAVASTDARRSGRTTPTSTGVTRRSALGST